MKAVGLTVLNCLKAMRAQGVAVEPLLADLSFTEASLEAGQVWVPWDDAARLFNRLDANVPRERVQAVVEHHLLSHPVLRALAQFAKGTTAWLELLWRASGPANPMGTVHYEVSDSEHRLVCRLHPGLAPSRAWFEYTHHMAMAAPLLVGAARLVPLSCELSGRHLDARYAAPVESRASPHEVPLSSVFTALESLGPQLSQALRDGVQGLAPPVDEVVALASAWGLTPMESRVTWSLADGRTPTQVAQVLGVSVGTVRVHLKHVYAKTKTAGQRELVERVRTRRLQ